MEDFQLGAAASIDLRTYALDGAPVELVLTGLSGPPMSVRRNNLQLPGGCAAGAGAADWCYDSADGTLRMIEPSGSFSRWSVTP